MEKLSDADVLHSEMRRVNKAEFIEIKKERFKYFKRFIRRIVFTEVCLPKQLFNYVKGHFDLFRAKVNIKEAIKDSSYWLLNAFVEGFILNFATYSLFDFVINPLTILSYGIVARKTVEFVNELRNHDTTPKVRKPNE